MQRLRVEGFTISVDGYGAGPNQSLENPLGVGGHALHGWHFIFALCRPLLSLSRVCCIQRASKGQTAPRSAEKLAASI